LFKVCDVDFYQFLDESWTEVPYLSLAIKEVPFMIRNEPRKIKNKIVKPQGTKKLFNPKFFDEVLIIF